MWKAILCMIYGRLLVQWKSVEWILTLLPKWLGRLWCRLTLGGTVSSGWRWLTVGTARLSVWTSLARFSRLVEKALNVATKVSNCVVLIEVGGVSTASMMTLVRANFNAVFVVRLKVRLSCYCVAKVA